MNVVAAPRARRAARSSFAGAARVVAQTPIGDPEEDDWEDDDDEEEDEDDEEDEEIRFG